MTDAQTKANAEYRASHPIPANETADAKATRLAAEKTEKDAQNAVSEPNTY